MSDGQRRTGAIGRATGPAPPKLDVRGRSHLGRRRHKAWRGQDADGRVFGALTGPAGEAGGIHLERIERSSIPVKTGPRAAYLAIRRIWKWSGRVSPTKLI